MYTSKQSFKYKDHIFELDMKQRGLKVNDEIITRYNKPLVGPYTSVDDFFKYFRDAEKDNPNLKADDETELNSINQGLNKTAELYNDKYEGIITFITDNERLHREYHSARTPEGAFRTDLIQEYFIMTDIISPTLSGNV